jgi:hypothetical protein
MIDSKDSTVRPELETGSTVGLLSGHTRSLAVFLSCIFRIGGQLPPVSVSTCYRNGQEGPDERPGSSRIRSIQSLQNLSSLKRKYRTPHVCLHFARELALRMPQTIVS